MERLKAIDKLLTFSDHEKGTRVSFSKNQIAVAHVISQVMNIAEVKDIEIKETELTDIVKEIYQHGQGV